MAWRDSRTFPLGGLGAHASPLPKRWVVEWTFAWIGRKRRLAKDYSQPSGYLVQNPRASKAWVYLGVLRLWVKRLARAA